MRLLLAAGKADLRLALELLLNEQPGVEIVGTASESDGLLALIHTTHPDMIVTDWRLPGRLMPAIISDASKSESQPRIIILANDSSDCEAALGAGADAAVLKGASPHLLLATFQSIRSRAA